MSLQKSRLDEILASFDAPPSSEGALANPADKEFERPSNFPEKVEVTKVESLAKTALVNPDLGDDYEHIRNVLRHLVDKGVYTLEGAINIAKETENARSIEVVSQLMHTISDVSDKLIKLHETTAKTSGAAVGKGQQQPAQGDTHVYILDKGKDAKDILNNLLGNALKEKTIEGEVLKDD